MTWKCVIATSTGQGKLNGMAPSRGYNSASGTLFRLKLTEDMHRAEAKKDHASII